METVYKVVIKTAQGQWMTLQFPWRGTRHLPKNQVLNAEPFGFVKEGKTLTSRGFTCFRDPLAAETFRAGFPDARNCVVVEGAATGVFPNVVNAGMGEMAHGITLIREV